MKHDTRQSSRESIREEALDHYAWAAPSDGLRARVLGLAGAKPRPPRSEQVLRAALAALVATWVWASWQEDRTAERMANLAVPVHGARPELPASPGEETLGVFAKAMLHPRARLPLPRGYASTRVNLWLTSLSYNDTEGRS